MNRHIPDRTKGGAIVGTQIKDRKSPHEDDLATSPTQRMKTHKITTKTDDRIPPAQMKKSAMKMKKESMAMMKKSVAMLKKASAMHKAQALKIDKRIPEAYFIKGMIYHFLGNSNLASSSYQTAIEVDPNYFDAYIHMGMLSENLDNHNAVNYYNSAIEIEPNNIEAWIDYSNFLYDHNSKSKRI